jgi:hypothetical protein
MTKRNRALIIPEMMIYKASSQLGLGRASAQVANMWYGRDAFNTNTNSEPLVVTNFSSRITLEAVKSGVNNMIMSLEALALSVNS